MERCEALRTNPKRPDNPLIRSGTGHYFQACPRFQTHRFAHLHWKSGLAFRGQRNLHGCRFHAPYCFVKLSKMMKPFKSLLLIPTFTNNRTVLRKNGMTEFCQMTEFSKGIFIPSFGQIPSFRPPSDCHVFRERWYRACHALRTRCKGRRAKGPQTCQPRATPWVCVRNETSPEGAQHPTCAALSGLMLSAGKPRALPWAGMFAHRWCSLLSYPKVHDTL